MRRAVLHQELNGYIFSTFKNGFDGSLLEAALAGCSSANVERQRSNYSASSSSSNSSSIPVHDNTQKRHEAAHEASASANALAGSSQRQPTPEDSHLPNAPHKLKHTARYAQQVLSEIKPPWERQANGQLHNLVRLYREEVGLAKEVSAAQRSWHTLL
jgi:hypothetical protein